MELGPGRCSMRRWWQDLPRHQSHPLRWLPSHEARLEMERMVREKFPDPSTWMMSAPTSFVSPLSRRGCGSPVTTTAWIWIWSSKLSKRQNRQIQHRRRYGVTSKLGIRQGSTSRGRQWWPSPILHRERCHRGCAPLVASEASNSPRACGTSDLLP